MPLVGAGARLAHAQRLDDLPRAEARRAALCLQPRGGLARLLPRGRGPALQPGRMAKSGEAATVRAVVPLAMLCPAYFWPCHVWPCRTVFSTHSASSRCPLPAARCPLPAARCPLPAARCHGRPPACTGLSHRPECSAPASGCHKGAVGAIWCSLKVSDRVAV